MGKLFEKNEKAEKKSESKIFPTGFTVMLIPDSADAAKSRTVTFDMIVKFIVGGICIAIIIIGLIVSMMLHNHSLKKELDSAQKMIDELEKENSGLGESVSQLNEQIKLDREAFEQIEDTINEKKQETLFEEEQAAIPMGVPIINAGYVVVKDPNEGIKKAESKGMVFSTTAGAVIVATASGTVESVTDDDFYLSKIIIDHNNGYKTVYRIQSDATVKKGTAVEREDMIGVMPSDGIVSYEILKDGKNIDPRSDLTK